MNLVFHIILTLLLLLAFYQDWKFRAITWFVFPLLALVSTLIFLQFGFVWKGLGLNLTFVILVIGTLFLYVSIREKKFVNIFENHFGIGDVLFFIAVIPLFGLQNFMLFFISGLFLAGIFHLLIRSMVTDKTIPLAGYLGMYVLLLKTISITFQFDLFYSNLLG